MTEIIILIAVSYLTGSFPTAVLAGRILRQIDIREHGSGNAGATNVFRVLGWRAGIAVLIVDMFKGFIPVYWLTALIINETQTADIFFYYQIIAGVSAICGHIWTIFAGFRGGKGVGTAAGVFLGLQPVPVLISLGLFLFIVTATRYVSLGSISGALLLPITLLIKSFVLLQSVPYPVLVISVLLALLIVLTHRENIKRLLAGTENKISVTSQRTVK
jgi:glycerol-3-phosphate acyltransferase PlsY